MLDNANGGAMREYFDIPTRAVLAFLNAKEISKVQINPPEETDIDQHLAYFKCTGDAGVKQFALNSDELSQARHILKHTSATKDDNDLLDRMKAVEQILITVSQNLKEAEQIGFVQTDVPVWQLQPYCRGWDVYPSID